MKFDRRDVPSDYQNFEKMTVLQVPQEIKNLPVYMTHFAQSHISRNIPFEYEGGTISTSSYYERCSYVLIGGDNTPLAYAELTAPHNEGVFELEFKPFPKVESFTFTERDIVTFNGLQMTQVGDYHLVFALYSKWFTTPMELYSLAELRSGMTPVTDKAFYLTDKFPFNIGEDQKIVIFALDEDLTPLHYQIFDYKVE